MAGFTPEIPSMAQQFQHQQLQVEPQQVQQMAAVMSMTAAGMMNNGLVQDAGTAVQPTLAPGTAPALVPDASSAPAFGGVDPSTAQAMAMAQQMYMTYLQQAQMAAAAPFTAAPPMPNYGVPPTPLVPAISVSVEGMKFQYQLTEDDLLKVFSRYGSVREIRVGEVGTLAQITYDDLSYAQAAMNDLNGKVLNGLDGTLRISWASTAAQQPVQASPYPIMPQFPGGWGFPGNPAWPAAQAPGDFVPSSPQAPDTPPPNALNTSNITPDNKAPHVKGVRKYTCRFLVGIESDKDFQVVRRIIGPKGSNMKRIVKQSEAKLRLRGVGSGYFEGAGQKESSEPLQLCVSCTSSEGYHTAVALVEELMEGVYSEFRTFCRENGRPEPELHAKPQLVSSGRERGADGGGYDQTFSPEGIPCIALQMGDDDDDEDGGVSPNQPLNMRREGGRKRGRRSRGKRSEAGNLEKGEPPRNAPDVEEIHHMIDQRNEARRQCNFQEADRIRQSLHERGVALMDEPGGRGKATEVTTWRYWRE